MKAKRKTLSRIITAVLCTATIILCASGCIAGGSDTLSLREVGLDGITAKQLRGISELDLRDAGVTDTSLLAECAGLRILDLRGNNISVEQYEELQAALPECQIIWDVPILGELYDSTTKKLILEGENDGSISNIKYLNDLVYCDMTMVTNLDNEEADSLHDVLPDAQIIWNIPLGRSYVRNDIDEFSYSIVYGNDLSALKYCRQLESANMRYADDSVDFSVLAEIPTLYSLTISSRDITDFSALKNFTGITELYLYGTLFNDLSLISGLTQLEHLTIGDYIEPLFIAENLDDIKGLTSLKQLTAQGIGLKDISALKNMTELETLVIEGNPIEDFSPITDLTKLKKLDITNTYVSDLEFLSNLTDLDTLYLGDVDPVLSAAGYASESLGPCRIEDYSPISNLINLDTLIICHTDMSDVSFASSLKKARRLYLYDNEITDPTPILALPRLDYLALYDNPVAKDTQKAMILGMPNTTVDFVNVF